MLPERSAHLQQISLLTYGSRGDVQPFVALGVGLQQRGYRVNLAAPARFADFVQSYGLAFTSLPGDIAALSKLLVDRAGTNPLAQLREMNRFALPLALEVITQVRQACRQADLIIHTFMMTAAGNLMAYERGIPQISAQLFPIFTPTAAYPSLLIPGADLGLFNRFSHDLSSGVFRSSSALMYRFLRRKYPQIGPPRPGWCAPGKRIPLLLAYSPTVVPHDPAWGSLYQTTGFWQSDAPEYRPAPELAAFLAAGPPPIYIGFGSMVTAERARVEHAVQGALRSTGKRAIVQRGWLDLGVEHDDRFFAIDEVPHSWLFPQMAAIIHHGGAGTTGAALRAGVPSLIIPFAADQPFWARRTAALGVGPRAIPLRQLTVERLAAAITMCDQTQIRARAAEVGAQLKREHGVAAAVAAIETYYQRGTV